MGGPGLDDLPHDALFAICEALDARSLHMIAVSGRNHAICCIAKDAKLWTARIAREFPSMLPQIASQASAWAAYLRARDETYGPRLRFLELKERRGPFIRRFGGPACTSLPHVLTFGEVADICMLQARESCLQNKFRAAAQWIGRRVEDVNEPVLAAALRESFLQVFPPPLAKKHAERPRTMRSSSRKGGFDPRCTAALTPSAASEQPDDAVVRLLDKPAVRTTCDSFGGYLICRSDPLWLRHMTTHF